MTAQGGTLRSMWLRAPPQNRRAIFLMCYGVRFAEVPENRRGPNALYRFDRICRAHDIEHRLTQPNHRWTNGQVERMDRTLREATVKHYRYVRNVHLRDYLAAFPGAYNFARRLRTLRGLTPYGATWRARAHDPSRLRYDPTPLISGPDT